MSSLVRATAENAEKAKGMASEARSVAENGSKTMTAMTHAMAAIDASSAEVAKIVKNIDEIAFQTNILALNAAVEAARAGEAGAGFAVVADEVRSLAQRSAAAAKETADKIEVAIDNSRKGSQCTAKVEESLAQIAERVTSTDSLVAEIATAAREQAQGIEQINTAIAQLDKISQSNSASAEESASAAEELDAQAKTLKDQVVKLRQLVGGDSVTVSVSQASSPYLLPKMTRAITNARRRAILMPGDSV
jgi:methyl-accepting chemotaxis protein